MNVFLLYFDSGKANLKDNQVTNRELVAMFLGALSNDFVEKIHDRCDINKKWKLNAEGKIADREDLYALEDIVSVAKELASKEVPLKFARGERSTVLSDGDEYVKRTMKLEPVKREESQHSSKFDEILAKMAETDKKADRNNQEMKEEYKKLGKKLDAEVNVLKHEMAKSSTKWDQQFSTLQQQVNSVQTNMNWAATYQAPPPPMGNPGYTHIYGQTQPPRRWDSRANYQPSTSQRQFQQ